jgi:hypothetical protein
MNTEPLESGKLIDLGEDSIVKVQAGLKTPTHEQMEKEAGKILATDEAIAQWTKVVREIITKSKGEGAEVPEGETGKYIKYALDANGNLSFGKRHGRRKPRGKHAGFKKQRQIAIAGIAQKLFGAYLTSLFKAAKVEQDAAMAKAKEEGASEEELLKIGMAPLTQEKMNKAQKWAFTKAVEIYEAPERAEKKLRRLRQHTARRINFGLIAGNVDRRCHAEVVA